MARPKQVTAAKDHPQFGIKKGDVHWYVKIKTGPRTSREMRQMTPFKRSQLTQSEFLSALYDWQDSKADVGSHEDVQGLADTIREIGENERSKFDNMPEGLQQGDTGQLLEQRAEACETAASELEEIASEWETALEEHNGLMSEWETYQDELASYEADPKAYGDKPEEVEEPDEFDDEEYKSRIADVEVSI